MFVEGEGCGSTALSRNTTPSRASQSEQVQLQHRQPPVTHTSPSTIHFSPSTLASQTQPSPLPPPRRRMPKASAFPPTVVDCTSHCATPQNTTIRQIPASRGARIPTSGTQIPIQSAPPFAGSQSSLGSSTQVSYSLGHASPTKPPQVLRQRPGQHVGICLDRQGGGIMGLGPRKRAKRKPRSYSPIRNGTPRLRVQDAHLGRRARQRAGGGVAVVAGVQHRRGSSQGAEGEDEGGGGSLHVVRSGVEW